MHTLRRMLVKLNTVASKSFISRYKMNIPNYTKPKSFCSSIASTQNPHEEIIKEVCAGDEEKTHKLKVLMLEMELLRQEGLLVPEDEEMGSTEYGELLKLQTRSARRKYLEYVFKICRKRENRMKKKEETALKIQIRKESAPPKDLPLEEFVKHYDLQHNNIFLRFRESTMNNMYNNKLIQAMQFGQKLVVDCGFDGKMTDRENRNCSKQLMLLFGDNRVHDDPYDLHFCNYNKDSTLGQTLYRRIPTMFDPEFPLNVHEKSYLDLFPKEKLIYLSPHAKHSMNEYDHDAVYIIGAIVDKVNQEPLTMAKAKEENVKMVKFPLDRYLLWSGGSGKSLTLNQVILILLDLKKTGDWNYALRHVPRRKLVHLEDEVEVVKNRLLKQKAKWTPKVNLENLSYNHGRKNFSETSNRTQNKRRQNSVSSLFVK